MPLTPETLPRHELIGLPVRVVEAANPDLVGIAGRVGSETASTLLVESGASGRRWRVPKRGATFEFACTDEAAPFDSHEAKNGGTAVELGSETAGGAAPGQSGSCEAAAYVTVDGARLLSRPALRTETTGDSRWR